MRDSFYIAFQYIRFHKVKTLILVACITLMLLLPICMNMIVAESESQLMARADATPLVIGKKGSSLDLLMNTLYFGNEVPETATMEAVQKVEESGLAWPIPMYVKFKALSYLIVGTSLEYFDFRGLEISQGRQLAVLGECVIGAQVAEQEKLKPGDYILSSPENLFDLAGIYPLKMKITGVLAPSFSADDLAVFTDIKTTWVIQGLGHGHQDVTKLAEPGLVLARKKGNVAASAKLFHYNEITDDNKNSFHFHGSMAKYPVTGVIALPEDLKSGTLLQGRFLRDEEPLQIVESRKVITGLLDNIFRIKHVLDGVILALGLATLLAVFLVFSLSIRLREKELETIFKLGCSKQTITWLLSAEILIILLISITLCALFIWGISMFTHDIVRFLIVK